jgi:transcriptional regulator NrdR family protein
MTCPACRHPESRVVRTGADVALAPADGSMVPRERECCRCHFRFKTREVSDEVFAKATTALKLARELRALDPEDYSAPRG